MNAGTHPSTPLRRTRWGDWIRHKALPPAVAVVILLSLWEIAVRMSGIDPSLFVPPSRTLPRFGSVLTNELYVGAVGQTLRLLGLGFAIAASAGVALGLLLGRTRWLDRALTPWANGLYSAPLPALVPIITASIGFALGAKLLIVVMLGVFPVLINTYEGVIQTDKDLVEVARAFRSNELQTWRDVVLPYAMPYMLVGLRLGVVRSLIGTVVAEFYTSPSGLGYLILIYSRRFDMASMLVVVVTFTALGLLLVGLVAQVERRLTPWREETAT